MKCTYKNIPKKSNKLFGGILVLSISLDEIFNDFEGRFVVSTDMIFECVMNRMVIFVRIAMFVHEEHYRYILLSERPMVAVLIEFVSVQCFEIPLFGIDFIEQGISIHGYIVELAILLWIVVGNHVEVEEELDLA